MLTIRELIENSLLLVPDVDLRLSLQELKQGERFADVGGVYTFYSEYDEPLYVGISSNVCKRVPEHLGSAKGNIDLVNYVGSGKGGYVTVFYEEDKAYQELYESYLIRTLNPRFNISKTGRKKVRHE